MSLARKQFIIVYSMIFLTVISILTLLYFGMPFYYNQVKEAELKQRFMEVVVALDGKSKHEMLLTLPELDSKYNNLYLNLFDADGNVLYPIGETVVISSDDERELSEYDFDQIGVWSYQIWTIDDELLILQGEYAFNSLLGISQTLIVFYPFVLIFIILFISVISFVYSRLSTRRIKEISETTVKMQSLELGPTCTVQGNDEMSVLAQNINNLYDKLIHTILQLEKEKEKALSSEKRKSEYLRITSHELKTPLAGMIGLVEGMIYNVGDFKNHDKYLKKVREILREQENLVSSILDATNSDILSDTEFETIDLCHMLDSLMPSYVQMSESKGLKIEYKTLSDKIQIFGDPLYLEKAFKNLLDNALRYTKAGGKISVYFRLMDSNSAMLFIENQPEYMPTPNELEQIFNAFYRPDFSRNKNDGGSGIGLYLVKQIFDKHGFEYGFKQKENTLVFYLRCGK